MFQGSTTANKPSVKFLGIEDFWGHVWQWIDNIEVDVDLNIITSGPGATTVTNSNKTSLEDHPKYVHGTTELGFVIKATGGSSTEYFCNKQWLVDGTADVNYKWTHGGSSDNGPDYLGVFCEQSRAPTGSGSPRLMYM